MATPLAQLLDLLRFDADVQARFRAAPEAYLHDHGWGELDGADVQEAMYLLADAAPPADAVRWVAGGDAIDPDLDGPGDALATALERVELDDLDDDASDRWTDDPGDTVDDADDTDGADDTDAVHDHGDADDTQDDTSGPGGTGDDVDDDTVDAPDPDDPHDLTDTADVRELRDLTDPDHSHDLAGTGAEPSVDAPADDAPDLDELDGVDDLHDLTDPAHFDAPLGLDADDAGTTFDGPYIGDVELPDDLEPLDEPGDDGWDDVI